MPVPAVVLKAVIGEMAQAELLSSKRVLPAALQRAGFEFLHPRLEDALRVTLGRPRNGLLTRVAAERQRRRNGRKLEAGPPSAT